MSKLCYVVGEVAKAKKQRVEILSIESMERIFCRDVKSGKTQYFAARELQSVDLGSKEKESVEYLAILDEKERVLVSSRLEVIKPILSGHKKNRAQMVSKQAQAHGISTATVYNWLKAYELGEGKASSLAKRKRSNRKSRLGRSILKIVTDVIASHFETSQKPIMERTIEEVRRQCRDKGKETPSATTIRAYIKLRDQKQQTLKRHGAAQARSKHDVVLGEFPHAHAPLDVVQMDHSLMDVILVDDSRRHSIGKPWLTLAIDAYSRMIAGFYLSFENPTQFLVGLCLANAMLSKDLWLESLGLSSSAKNWPVWGKIERLHVDNAMEFRSNGLADLCQEYGTDLEFRPVKQPHHGGIVERFFRTLEGQVHTLPGSTFSNPIERGDYESEKRASMTLNEFERFIADWIASDYHITPHEGLGGRKPIDVWNEGIDGTQERVGRGIPAKLDNERDEILVHAMPTDTRVVTNRGIVWDYIHYTNQHFSRLRGEKIKVKRDPRNIKFIWFEDKASGQWLRAVCRDLSQSAMGLWDIRATQKALRESGAKVDEKAIFEGMARRKKLLEEASDKKRKATSSHKKALRSEAMNKKFASEERSKNLASPNKNKKLSIIHGGLANVVDDSDEEDFTKIPINILKVGED